MGAGRRRRTASGCSTRSRPTTPGSAAGCCPGLVRLVEANWANHVADVRLFEIGTAFAAGAAGRAPAGGAPGGRGPHRPARAGALDRHRRRRGSTSGISRAGSRPRSLWRFRGPRCRLKGRPGWSGTAQGRVVGEGGPLAADAPPWAAPLFGFELLVDPAPRRPAPFAPLPTTPSSERVLALLLPEGVRARQVEDVAPAGRRRAARAGGRRERLPRRRAAGRHAERGVPAHVPRRRTARCATARWTRPRRGSWPRWPTSWASSDGTASPAPEGDRGIHLRASRSAGAGRARAGPRQHGRGAGRLAAADASRPRPSCKEAQASGGVVAGHRAQGVAPAGDRAGDREPGAAAADRRGQGAAPGAGRPGSRSSSSTAEATRHEPGQERREGDHRRRGVHRPLRAAAGVHPRGRGLSRRRAQAGARLAADGRDPQGRHPRRAGDHRRAVPGPPRRPPDRGPAHPAGRRVRPHCCRRPSAAAARPPPSGDLRCPSTSLLPALVGVVAGLVVALVGRSR